MSGYEYMTDLDISENRRIRDTMDEYKEMQALVDTLRVDIVNLKQEILNLNKELLKKTEGISDLFDSNDSCV